MSLTQVVTWDENGKLARTKDFLSSPTHWYSLSYLFSGEKVNDVALDWHSEYITSDFISGSMGAFVVTTTGTSLKIYSVANLQGDPTATLRHTYTMGDSSVSGSARIAVSKEVVGFVVVHWCEQTKCMVGRSTNGGVNWGTAVQVGSTFTANLLNDNAECGLAIEGQQQLCSGHDGTSYRVYRASTTSGSFALLGTSPSNPTPFSSIQVDRQGSVYVSAPNLPGLSGSTDDIGMLFPGGMVYTDNFTVSSPTWSYEDWTPFHPTNNPDGLGLLNSGEVVQHGVQKPGEARTFALATTTHVRVFEDTLNGTHETLSYTLRASNGNNIMWRRRIQIERGNPEICYVLTHYSDGLWSEGFINGTPITPVQIGSAGHGGAPPLFVDPNDPMIAYSHAHNGSVWTLYKTADGGQSWSENSDYASPTFGIASIARSFSDPSRLFVGRESSEGDPNNKPGRLYRCTASAVTEIASSGASSFSRTPVRTFDNDSNTLLWVRFRQFAFSNFATGVQKSHDDGDNWTTILADDTECCYGITSAQITPGGILGGDGSVFIWMVGTDNRPGIDGLYFHPNIYTLTDFSQMQKKWDTTGANMPHILVGL